MQESKSCALPTWRWGYIKGAGTYGRTNHSGSLLFNCRESKPFPRAPSGLPEFPPIVKQTIGTITFSESLLATPHFAVGLVLQKAFSGHCHTDTSLLGRGGGIRTHSAVKQQIYSLPRLSNFGAPLYVRVLGYPRSHQSGYSSSMRMRIHLGSDSSTSITLLSRRYSIS